MNSEEIDTDGKIVNDGVIKLKFILFKYNYDYFLILYLTKLVP